MARDPQPAGLVLARVVDNQDPEGRHRVRVQRMDRPDGVLTDWAQIVTPMASGDAGMAFLPEIDALAVLAYSGSLPFVLGFVWGGDDTPPSTAPLTRTIRSVNGHVITLDDGAADGITIADAHGNEVVMASDRITVTAAADLTIKASGNITIEASGTTTIKGATVELNP